MADGMHAVVFVDNHDNQRGHGGGGGVLTASSKSYHDNQRGHIGGGDFLTAGRIVITISVDTAVRTSYSLQ